MKSPFWKPHKSTQKLVVHRPSDCKGRHCCVHNPSNHHMRDWPQNYRTDTGVMERVCSHGVGHPDPDQPWPKNDPRWIHGCDGCCSPERELPKGDGCPIRIVLDEPTPPFPEITQELLDKPAFKVLSGHNPIVYLAPSINVPPEVYAAAEALHIFFTKEGHQQWQLGPVASRQVVTRLEQEKRDLAKECASFREALTNLDRALENCVTVPDNVLPAWYAAGLLFER